MANNETPIIDLAENVNYLRARLAEAEATLEEATRRGLENLLSMEPIEYGIVSFKHTYSGGRAYTYAAIRVGEEWTTTADRESERWLNWRELVEFADPGSIMVADTWTPVVQ